MLVERSPKKGGWGWAVDLATPEPSYREVAAGGWHVSVVGAYPPALITWLAKGVGEGKSPRELLAGLWERHDAHCAVVFLRDGGDEAVVGVDPYAVAKIYVHESGGRWLLATRLSEILRAAPEAAAELEPHACAYFLWQGFTPSSHTYYKGVTKIPPCTILTVEAGAGSQDRYLDVGRAEAVGGEEYLQRVRGAWERSLLGLLNSFDSHRVALSGGLDSSLLLASLLRLGLSPERCEATTCVPLGGEGGRVVLNPRDREFAGRVARHYGVRHELVPYRWDGAGVLGHFLSAVEDLGTEAGPGAQIFKALAWHGDPARTGFYSAQNADSIFSFACTGRPTLKAGPPFVAGLGGWAARANLFGELDRRGSVEAVFVRIILGLYLRRRYGVRLRDQTAVHRLLGMTFDSQKWPVHLNDQRGHLLADSAGLAEWFEENYITRPDLLSLFEQNPHAAFVWLFLQDFMQGRDNRATVWPTSAAGAPIFLPFASLEILRLTAGLVPDLRFRWYGKYPVVWMARRHYGLPDYVVDRCDPPTPELDRLQLETFFANGEVYEYLDSFLPERAAGLFEGIVERRQLELIISQFRARNFRGANLSLLLSMSWMLTLEQVARDRGRYARAADPNDV